MKSSKSPQSKIYTLALVTTFLAVLVHGYLAHRHFEVSLGHPQGESLCNISQEFNCDAVAASSFSHLFGIPLAIWGMVTNLVLLLLALTTKLTWDNTSSSSLRWTSRLSLLVLLASIIMAVISFTQMNIYCPFCILTYLLSIFSFLGFFFIAPQAAGENLIGDIQALFTHSKGTLALLIAIPAGAWLSQGVFLNQYKTTQKDIDRFVKYQIQDWKSSPSQNIDLSRSRAIKGASEEEATMTIVEFADFLCGHCQAAAPKLDAFIKTHPKARLVFMNFPLDNSCDDPNTIPAEVSTRCRFAKLTVCAKEKTWPVHDYLFKNARQLSSLSAQDQVKEVAAKYGFNKEDLEKCVNSKETHRVIAQQKKLGVQIGVKGTPAIYVNGRRLSGGQNLPLLKAAYSEL